MATTNRVGTWLIMAGSLILAGMMAYALSLGGSRDAPGQDGASIEVAVFYPDTNSWRNFRQGVRVCEELGLVRMVEGGTDSLVVRDARGGPAFRFSWDGSLGIRESRESLRRRLESATPPVAVVGSTNTALTVGLAETLAEHAATRGGAPPLLIPSATAVAVDSAGGRMPLLAIHPGHSFRVCLNNARLAELVVGYLAEARGERPSDVVLVADSYDPFSEDLAAEFVAAVGRRFPGISLSRSDPRPGPGGLAGAPSAEEVELAESIWSKAAAARSAGGSLWVLLTTQGSPAQRLLEVLRAKAPPTTGRPDNLRVLCGDGIGRPTLSSFVGLLPFPVYSAASTSVGAATPPALHSGSGQIEAEVVAGLLDGLRRCEGRVVALADSLTNLRPTSTEPGPLGRPIAFVDGERAGEIAPGHVLEARPDEPSLLAHQPAGRGHWLDLRWTSDAWRPASAAAGP